MPLDIYTPMDLYAVMFDPRQTVRTSTWLDTFYPNSFMSEQEEIMFDKIDATREIAPFMLPNLPGRPIYKGVGERIESFKPAYTKPKDAIRPSQALKLQPGELAKRLALQTPEARYNAKVVEIAKFHRDAITRLWEYMGARALIDGAITINYAVDAGTPAQAVTIDFGRDAGHTITKAGGSQWGDVGVSAWDDIQAWYDLAAAAEFGAAPTDILMGSKAYAAFLADADVQAKLNKDIRGNESVTLDLGLIQKDPLNPFTLVGKFGTVNVWLVSGIGNTFKSNGTSVDILKSNEVLLVSRAVDGVKAFGAILDGAANLQPADIFSKMWDQEDPSARFIMSQSAPLMIPVNPNATVKAVPVSL
ncbi:major head protein [Ruegeria phage vB_RpoS-V18]|uniref:major head protein n=2 Tax=unclassified Casjensviridae TaxID=2960002 RepID=UPI000DCABA18|nr:major head protein [Ruegeria phage vB_RpoS-V18]YP_009997355.1 major head protein [Ruegeria phage vB_RpoS-V11]AWY08932.1 major capsid protein [Ruegeria phage vB_RpoS-V18]AWY09096.1 major capsid protein [Ruegeria phage vB_RpoS-V11]